MFCLLTNLLTITNSAITGIYKHYFLYFLSVSLWLRLKMIGLELGIWTESSINGPQLRDPT